MKRYILLLVAFLFIACEGEIFVEEKQKLVVEGYIEDGQFPVVMVSTTIPVSENYQLIDELDQYMVKWAKVCIIHDNDTTILTGMPNRQYFPPYVYTTSYLRGKAGERYKITVDYRSFHAEGEVTVMPTIELDSIWAEPVENDESLYAVKARFHDDPTKENYYNFYVSDSKYSEMFVLASIGTLSDSQFQGKERIVTIMRGMSSMEERNQPYFYRNEDIVVKFSNISEDSFTFWRKYQDMLSFSRNMFLSSFEHLPTNLSGAIGYFHGQSAKYYELHIAGSEKY